MRYELFGLDPGGTCGVAQVWLPKKHPAEVVRCVEVPGTPTEILVEWQLWLKRTVGARRVCIVEDWIDWKQGADGRSALLVIGMMQVLCAQENVLLVLQNPQARLDIPDTKLGLGDYWLPDLKEHDDRRQALRHILAWIKDHELHRPTLLKLFPPPTRPGRS